MKSCGYQLFQSQQHLYICCVHERTHNARGSFDPVHNHFVQIRTHMLTFALLTFALTHVQDCDCLLRVSLQFVCIYICSCLRLPFNQNKYFLNKNFFLFLVDRIGLLFIINKWLLFAAAVVVAAAAVGCSPLLLLSLFVCSENFKQKSENIAPFLFWHFNRWNLKHKFVHRVMCVCICAAVRASF